MAAKRGVDIRIVTPSVAKNMVIQRLSRSYYNFLIEAGVRIYEYAPGSIHAKSFVSDDKIAVVGTINLDYRSLYLHFECAALLYNTNAIKDIKKDALKTIADGYEISLNNNKRKAWSELIDAILHLIAPLL